MPVVTAQASNLQAVGPIIDVEVSPRLRRFRECKSAGVAVPLPIKISALIDTGASRSVIQSGLPKKLGAVSCRHDNSSILRLRKISPATSIFSV